VLSVRVNAGQIALPLRARVGLENDTVLLPVWSGEVASRQAVSGRWSRVVVAGASQAPELGPWSTSWASPYQLGRVTPWAWTAPVCAATFAARGVVLSRDSAQQVAHGTAVPWRPSSRAIYFFQGESGNVITHVAFAGKPTHWSTPRSPAAACWSAMASRQRAASLRQRLVAVRRLEDR